MRRMPKGVLLLVLLIVGMVASGGMVGSGAGVPEVGKEQGEGYRSPYRVAFSVPAAGLVADLEGTERGDPRREGSVPFSEWYSRGVFERFGSWGPRARAYPPAPGVEGWPVDRLRERVIAVALRFEGYAYQHHHIPDWDPPPGWRWKSTCAGANGPGVDCSNFTGFVYNQGFGIRLNTDVTRQAGLRFAEGPGRARTPLERVELPGSYGDRLAALRTGDLLFVRNRAGSISHVVLWVGPIGRSPDGEPLVLDSHGEDTRDSNGELIPCGVRLRPFREDSWYNRSASHALRVFSSSGE
ncbi:NlpC/P60 family protein [Tautonia sp. JC769]|uniref:NlpC/P60 family protein n=1 Tax=Tautonia sp. JC769 TaxID=3232135 RepID=UPI00345B21BA